MATHSGDCPADAERLHGLFEQLRSDFNAVQSDLVGIERELSEISRHLFRGNGRESISARLTRIEERVQRAEEDSDSGWQERRWMLTTAIASLGLLVAMASVAASVFL